MSESVRLELKGRKADASILPAALSVGNRGAIDTDPFLGSGVVTARSVIDLSRASRDAAAAAPLKPEEVGDQSVLALETGTGETLFIHPQTLREAALRRGAIVDGALRLDDLVPTGSGGRGLAGFLWSKVSVLELSEDSLIAEAKKKAAELAEEWLGKKVQKVLIEGPSWVGARALAWVIESRLLQSPGLYRWVGAKHESSDLRSVSAAELESDAAEGPLLLFIHGTASNTSGGFADLRADSAEWDSIQRMFGKRIYAYEHHTLSSSPVENAIHLARSLPKGAKLRIVTHSRGGLVGDLLCLNELTNDEINTWDRRPAPGTDASEIEAVVRRERELLRELRDVLKSKELKRERYVRVACPARGTLLASANLDVFLSALLSVVGTVTGLRASRIYSGLARLVLEVAKRRMDPQVIPGIEAMLPDAPLPALLSRARRAEGVQFSVIAGDIEGGNLWQRLGVLMADWTLFDDLDNDLVVDTDSMYEGLARDGGAKALFDQGPRVNHFRYFENARTRKALAGWLVPADPDASDFEPLADRRSVEVRESERRSSRAAAPTIPDGSKPVVFFLPGIMGSHLRARTPGSKGPVDARVWFSLPNIMVGWFKRLEWTPGSDGRPLEPDGLFEMFYGDLCDHLESTHHVVRFAYDWRKPIQDEARRLKGEVEKVLDLLGDRQPVRLLAHSMGGLVCRTLLQTYPEVWKRITAHSGGRFIMLGTPNNGSHLLVQHLVGKASTTRNLARIDLRNSLKDILQVAATLPGALQLLPRPGFVDTAGEQEDTYFTTAPWEKFQKHARDRWFGDGSAVVPNGVALDLAGTFWSEALPTNEVPGPVDRVAYVFGVDSTTACGVRVDAGKGGLQMLVTAEGDGSVTWKSGRLANLPDNRHWWIPAAHGDMARTKDAFPGIVQLLQSGDFAGANQGKAMRRGLPVATRALAARAVPFEPGPPVMPTEEELAAGILGRPRPEVRRTPTARRRLKVSVTAGDLTFVQKAVICGHYQNDPIAGAEDVLDRQIVKGGLRQRERLGYYANEIGSSAVVLLPMDASKGSRAELQGALVVGLGEYGTLTSSALVETVRCGVLRLLVVCHERGLIPSPDGKGGGVPLAPLLLGYNSTTHISIEDSLASVIRGVIAANRQFAEVMPTSPLQVTELEFVELYRDTAISAAHALRDLPARMRTELTRAQVVLEPAECLGEGEGALPRLLDTGSSSGYWPRMLVTDADGDAEGGGTAGGVAGSNTRIAQRLRYLFLSQRARAEAVVQQRQPQLIETLVAGAIQTSQFDLELSRLFFQLMVPQDFKEAARLAERLLLVVDGATANFPWEMVVAEKEPLVTRTELVRQLASTRFRARIKQSTNQSAFVLGNPSTEGFGKVFAVANPALEKQLPSLGGAVKEAGTVAGILQRLDFDVLAPSPWSIAREVLGGLFHRPHRILHIAAHGIFSEAGRDGQARTGVVLSDGIVLSAAEVSQLEVVPELVFLNCCHLGVANASPREGGRIAYSLARELIESGVRCVIAAGWEVDDQAAELFASTFYRVLLAEGKNFGEAVLAARKRVWEEMPDCNTWGAYQAYGDPAYRLGKLQNGQAQGKERRWVSSQELEAELKRLVFRVTRRGQGPSVVTAADLRQMLESAPAAYLALPEIQEHIARFHAALGDFGAAAEAFENAIRAVDRHGTLSVRVIEQLANLEARQGERTDNEALINQAIARIGGLLVVCAQEGHEPLLQSNPERLAIYASALKRKASFLLKTAGPSARDRIRDALEKSREAYRAAAGNPESGRFEPYPVTNYLQFALLTKAVPPEADLLLKRAAERADADFARKPDFFSAIIAVDVELTRAAIEGRLARSEPELLKLYQVAGNKVPADEQRWDSVTNQLRFLSRFGAVLGMRHSETEALDRIADELSPESADSAGSAGSTPAGKASSKPGSKSRRARTRQTPARRRSA